MHLLLELSNDFSEVATQQVSDRGNAFFVIVLVLFADTGTEAIADVVFQADPEFAFFNVLLREGERTRPDGIKLTAEFQDGMHGLHTGERPEVLTSIFDQFTRGEDAWEALFFYDDEGIRLVVFELDVVDRPMLFDQAVFEQKCIRFRGSYEPFDVGDLRNEQTRFAVVVLFREIAGNPFFQVLGFPHVKQPLTIIEILVNARLLRQTR